MPQRIDILGVMIDVLDKNSLHRSVKESLSEKKRIKIFTPNPEIVLSSLRNENLKAILSQADICIADGVGLVMASKILGTPLPERLAGIELGEFLLEYAAQNNLSVFLLGGKKGVAELAKSRLEARYEGLNICGTYHGFFDVDNTKNDELIQYINAVSPDIIFVCMGFPRQERWICENECKIPSLLILVGLGGSLDVWSGKIRRAPAFFRTLSLEWLWRVIKEPRRIKIIYRIPIFLVKVIAQKVSKAAKNRQKNGKNAHKF